jgi:hypothetical protein
MSRLTDTGVLIGPEGGKQIGLSFEGGRPMFSEGNELMVVSTRTRVAIADINAGKDLLSGIPGLKYRLIDAMVIAVGGAVGALTTIDISGTQSGSVVALFSYAQASLLQSVPLLTGVTGTTVLADGASFIQCDAGTGISIKKTGNAGTTATHVDVILTFTFGR